MNEEYIPPEQFNLIIEALKKQLGTTDDLIGGDFIDRLWDKLKSVDALQPSGIH